MATELVGRFYYMTLEPPTTFHRWSQLERDIKIRILTWHLNMDWQFEETNSLNYASHVHEYLELIFQTLNRELLDMAQELSYSANEFTIHLFVDDVKGNNP